MDNHDIDRFFEESKLTDSVRRLDRPPNVIWQFQAGVHPAFIQTQENVNRMRIVVDVADASAFDQDELTRLLEANYHSALDARYALTDDRLVAAFIHPFRELTLTQFVLGMYQTIQCAETCGSRYSGGTLVFGGSAGSTAHGRARGMEQAVDDIMAAIEQRIRRT